MAGLNMNPQWGQGTLNNVGTPDATPAIPNYTDFNYDNFGLDTDSFNLDSAALGENMGNGVGAGLGALSNYGGGGDTSTGIDWGSLQGWGQLLGGLGEIGSAYMGYKNYGLAKDQFKFNKQFANRNIANQATVVNEQLAHKRGARIASGGAAPNRPLAQVDGSPIQLG